MGPSKQELATVTRTGLQETSHLFTEARKVVGKATAIVTSTSVRTGQKAIEAADHQIQMHPHVGDTLFRAGEDALLEIGREYRDARTKYIEAKNSGKVAGKAFSLPASQEPTGLGKITAVLGQEVEVFTKVKKGKMVKKGLAVVVLTIYSAIETEVQNRARSKARNVVGKGLKKAFRRS